MDEKIDDEKVKVLVRELGTVVTGNTPSKSNDSYWNSEDICFVKPDKIDDVGITYISETDEYISEDAREKARVVTEGAIFVTCIGSIGKIGIAQEGEFAFNQQINVIIPNGRVISKYFAYNLLYNKFRLTAIANSAVVPIINKSQFSEFELSIVEDKAKQRNIVDNLDLVARIIDKRKCQLKKLDNLIKARFIELFGDPVANSMGWQTKPITAVCHKIFGGGTPSKSHPEYFTGSIPWVSPKDMKASVISDSIDHITEDAIAQSTTNLIPSNSVLMVIRSGILKHTLPIAINSVSVTINQDMKAFVPNGQVTAEYLLHYFKGIEADVLSGVRGVTADNIDFKTFQLREIIVPPIEMQNKFADFVAQVDKSKVSVQKSLDELQLLFDSLMQEYFG